MTVKELSVLVKSQIEVKSGYNGKLLCRNYSEKKHSHISAREVISLWSEIRVTNSCGYGNSATPIVCVYVHGEKEYNDTHKKDTGNE